jgi:hypothetical protein
MDVAIVEAGDYLTPPPSNPSTKEGPNCLENKVGRPGPVSARSASIFLGVASFVDGGLLCLCMWALDVIIPAIKIRVLVA